MMEPGIHRGLTFAEYLAIPAINHSTLALFSRSPRHAYEGIHFPPEPTKALDLGQAIHSVILEPKRFTTEYAVVPKCDRRTKAGKAAWAEFEDANRGKILLPEPDYRTIEGMMNSAWSNFGALLGSNGLREVVAVWEKKGDLFKARIDFLVNYQGEVLVVDLKSTRNAGKWAFARSVADYHYHSQGAFYLDGLSVLFPGKRRFWILAIEKDSPFCCALYEVDANALEQGRNDYRHWLATYNECLAKDSWPGYPTNVQMLELPRWAFRPDEWELTDDE